MREERGEMYGQKERRKGKTKGRKGKRSEEEEREGEVRRQG